MKGTKIYLKALQINKELYEYPKSLSEIEISGLYQEYFLLLKKAAYLGHSEAQYDFAQQYENISFLGMENPMYNPKKCVFWYTKACEKNHPEACNNLAALYESGKGCVGNLDKALSLYKKSKGLGSKLASKNYRIMLKDMQVDGKYGNEPNR